MGRAHASMGERLRTARIEKQWTQEYVAAEVGVEPVTYARWERGQHRPHPFYHNKLCSLFGKSAQELGLSGSDSTPNDGIGKGESDQQQEAAQSPLHIEEISLDQAPDEVAAFGMSDLTSRLEAIVWAWLLNKVTHAARYHELQMRITLELEDDNCMYDDPITRRDALKRLARLPIGYCGLTLIAPNLTRPTEEILATCASGIIACWHMRKGGHDLVFADSAVAKYIPTLKALVSQEIPAQRKEAASLLVQCFLLRSAFAWSLSTMNEALSFAKQAEAYGKLADDPVLQIVALRKQTAAYCYANQWKLALETAQKAEYLLLTSRSPIPKYVESYVYAGLGTYQAYHGQKQEALRSLGKAQATFFAGDADEDVPIWSDHHIGNVFINDGQAHTHLGMYKEALDSYMQIHEAFKVDSTIVLECDVEAFINQAMTEVSRDDPGRDMERCIAYWLNGIEGAKSIQSKQRFGEAVQAYQAMRAAWPGEARIKELRDLIIQ
jgi:transcriptional regulator with XRE-family HTH domain